MNLTEHQAKRVLERLGIAIPDGIDCPHPTLVRDMLPAAGEGPWIVKAQIRAGGRALGRFAGTSDDEGGVRRADTAEAVDRAARAMWGKQLVTAQTGPAGERVESVYVEACIAAEREAYLALAIDRVGGALEFLVSTHGGVDIERHASDRSMHHFPIGVDIERETLESVGAEIADLLAVQAPRRDDMIALVVAMHEGFVDRDMLLLEINPLAEIADGSWVALDAAVAYDDNALFRQGHEEQMEAYEGLSGAEMTALGEGLNYVPLEGDIAIMSAGAGLAMATVDAVVDAGGRPANFLDVPPSIATAPLRTAIELLYAQPGVRCVLVNVFGGGIMRCDGVADALLMADAVRPENLPVVVRLAGTSAELGRQRLVSAATSIYRVDDFADAAERAVALAGTAGGP